MLEEKKLQLIALLIFKLTKPFADQTEVILGTDGETTIRFANNQIYQPLSTINHWLKIRLIKNKKIAVVGAFDLSQPVIRKIL